MAATDLFVNADCYTLRHFEDCVFGGKMGALENPKGFEWEFLVRGQARGRLCGGNLAVLTSLLGTPFEIDSKDKIIFLEEIGEEPYRVDRMINQLRLAGKFKDCAGVVFGDFADCGSSNNSLNDSSNSPPNKEDIREIILKLQLSVPVLYNFKCGHCSPSASLPLGAMAQLDSNRSLFEIIVV